MADQDGMEENVKRRVSSKRRSTVESVANVAKKGYSPRNCFELNTFYHEPSVKAVLSSLFQKKTDKMDVRLDNGAHVTSKPFPYCVLPDFLSHHKCIKGIEDLQRAVKELPFVEKSNDMFKFSQTNDFKGISGGIIKSLTNFLYKDFLPWVCEVTGLNLNNRVDVSASRYSHGDYLLCHNDLWETRKVAFIYYLVHDWTAEDGGTLDFFGTSDDVKSSVIPSLNTFVFFEVHEDSYHQVSEVLSNKHRLAISGWFHSNPEERGGTRSHSIVPLLPEGCPGGLTHFINATYLTDETKTRIRGQFESTSEILLPKFLSDGVYADVCRELESCENWKMIGPRHKRFFRELECEYLPPTVKALYKFLHSVYFVELLSSLAGLDLLAPTSSPLCESGKVPFQPGAGAVRSQVCKWSPGSYTMVHGMEESCIEKTLDGYLFFNCTDWKDDHGGRIVYVSNDQEEALLDLTPVPNSFALVYSENEVMHFTEYVNHKVDQLSPPFYNTIMCSYFEVEDP